MEVIQTEEVVEPARHTRTTSMWKHMASEACDDAMLRVPRRICLSLNLEVMARRLRVFHSLKRSVLLDSRYLPRSPIGLR